MKRLFTIIIVLAVSLLGGASAAGQKVNPDTLTISKTIPAYGCSAERMFDIVKEWNPSLAVFREKSAYNLNRKNILVFYGKADGFSHGKAETPYGDHLFFDVYVKCMKDSCILCVSNIEVICNHGSGHVFKLSSYDDNLNRTRIWLSKNVNIADSARAYSLELFYSLAESLETFLNSPSPVQMRRIR